MEQVKSFLVQLYPKLKLKFLKSTLVDKLVNKFTSYPPKVTFPKSACKDKSPDLLASNYQ